MKIWFDITNSPHVNFFEQMIRDLQKDHEVIITTRPLANTIDLLDMSGFNYHVVGKHYGQSSIKKIFGFVIRIWQLYSFLKGKGLDVGISHSSFYSPVVSKMLGIRCIYLNDNEHAAGNKISFVFADKIMIPEFLDVKKVEKQWAKRNKIIQYPGVKEGIYLWHFRKNETGPSRGKNGRKFIYIRPEPWTAQYYTGSSNFMDDLIIGIKDQCDVTVLPRGAEQTSHYRQDMFKGVTAPDKSIKLEDIMNHCDLFIGAGGTMTREAAVLGIPTISVYQDHLLDVDSYLIERGFMSHEKNLTASFTLDYLSKASKREPDIRLLNKGKSAFDLIIKNLVNG
jgi:uncharacterized protein